jgi:hypothetical protein
VKPALILTYVLLSEAGLQCLNAQLFVLTSVYVRFEDEDACLASEFGGPEQPQQVA